MDDFTAVDGGGNMLFIASALPRGHALAVAESDGAETHVGLTPDDVRRLRDWCNALLERNAAHLPAGPASPPAPKAGEHEQARGEDEA